MAERYYHTVRGKRKLCRLWSPPDSDAYWHMCGDPEDVAALTIPTRGGSVVLDVMGREHATKIELVMKELKERARRGMINRDDFSFVRDRGARFGDLQPIDLLLVDLGIEPKSKDTDAMRSYAERQVYTFAGPRGGRPRRQRWEGETPPWLARRPVSVQRYRRRR